MCACCFVVPSPQQKRRGGPSFIMIKCWYVWKLVWKLRLIKFLREKFDRWRHLQLYNVLFPDYSSFTSNISVLNLYFHLVIILNISWIRAWLLPLSVEMSISEAMIIRASGEYDCEVVGNLKLEGLRKTAVTAISILQTITLLFLCNYNIMFLQEFVI